MTFILGLTGGIASGKSTVVDFFKAKNISIVDGDIIARELVAIGQPALLEIQRVFGPDSLQKNGELNRQALGERIFSNQAERKKLDDLMAPYLRAEITRQIEQSISKQEPLVIVDLPLLYEAGYESFMDKVAVVYVEPSEQIRRLMRRNHLTEEQAVARISSQIPLKEKKKRADIVFDNSHSKEKTERQIENWLFQSRFIAP